MTTVGARKLGEPDKTVLGHETALTVNANCEDWKVPSDPPPNDIRQHGRLWATLRRIGWLDQKGRVWTEIPATADFDGGSLTPLLVDVRES